MSVEVEADAYLRGYLQGLLDAAAVLKDSGTTEAINWDDDVPSGDNK